MKIIKGSSKTGQRLLVKASKDLGSELRAVYGRWSDDKENAMRDCKVEYLEDKGYKFRIISANRYYFSVAWNYTNKDTGEEMTKIKTGQGMYIIDGSRAKEE